MSEVMVTCPDCKVERLVARRQITHPRHTGRCLVCSRRSRGRERNYNWKGGKYPNGQGYMMITPPEDFFKPMLTKVGYMLEHRYVMAKYLGRCLQPWEEVHHKNGIKDDNRIENLELSEHIGNHIKRHSLGYKDGYAQGYAEGLKRALKEAGL